MIRLFALLILTLMCAGVATATTPAPADKKAEEKKPEDKKPEEQKAEDKRGGAEYAVRWDIAAGGPQTAEEALKLLGQAGGDSDEYNVTYFNVKAPADAPPGAVAILRQRTNKSKVDLMLKYHSRSRVKVGSWKCPLPNPTEAKAALDVSFATDSINRVFSYSCTIEAEKPIEPPAALAASNPCASKMNRTKAGNLKVDFWELPKALKVIEVSRNGDTSKKDREAFRRGIVNKLKRAGVKPLERGMAELGMRCK